MRLHCKWIFVNLLTILNRIINAFCANERQWSAGVCIGINYYIQVYHYMIQQA